MSESVGDGSALRAVCAVGCHDNTLAGTTLRAHFRGGIQGDCIQRGLAWADQPAEAVLVPSRDQPLVGDAHPGDRSCRRVPRAVQGGAIRDSSGRHSPRFHRGLRQRGKTGKVALVTVMCKLLLHRNAVALGGPPWLPQEERQSEPSIALSTPILCCLPIMGR